MAISIMRVMWEAWRRLFFILYIQKEDYPSPEDFRMLVPMSSHKMPCDAEVFCNHQTKMFNFFNWHNEMFGILFLWPASTSDMFSVRHALFFSCCVPAYQQKQTNTVLCFKLTLLQISPWCRQLRGSWWCSFTDMTYVLKALYTFNYQINQ